MGEAKLLFTFTIHPKFPDFVGKWSTTVKFGYARNFKNVPSPMSGGVYLSANQETQTNRCLAYLLFPALAACSVHTHSGLILTV